MMKAPVTYYENFLMNPKRCFDVLWNELDWVRHDKVPRREYYCNKIDTPYTYGRGAGVRTYYRQPIHPMIAEIWEAAESFSDTKFEVCFLNGYENSKDQLGWHADDSPEMDDARKIDIVTLGAARELWFRPIGDKLAVEKLKPASGSLTEMAAGMQDTHYHRIPKSEREDIGARISLTFRGYKA